MTATSEAPVDPPAFAGDAFFEDPYSTYARIRGTGSPVYQPSANTWLFARYDDVEALLRDTRTSKSVQRAEPTAFETSVLFRDPPDHGRIREVLNRAFSSQTMGDLDNLIGRVADRMIDRIERNRPVDFIASFALPLPVAVIAELMGVSEEDAATLHRLSGEFIPDDSVPQAESQQRQHAAICAMSDYFQRLIASRDCRLDQNVLSVLARAHEEGALSRDELLGNCILLIIAGHETTVNLLGNGLHVLLRHPDQADILRRTPEAWPGAIEEMLRYESPVQLGTFRVATEALQYADVRLEPGSLVTAVIGSANRDPEYFREPDRFDIGRTPNRHLAFGMGPHRCLGAMLARSEARIGFSRLFKRLPGLTLSARPSNRWFSGLPWKPRTPTRPKWRHNAITRGLTELWIS